LRGDHRHFERAAGFHHRNDLPAESSLYSRRLGQHGERLQPRLRQRRQHLHDGQRRQHQLPERRPAVRGRGRARLQRGRVRPELQLPARVVLERPAGHYPAAQYYVADPQRLPRRQQREPHDGHHGQDLLQYQQRVQAQRRRRRERHDHPGRHEGSRGQLARRRAISLSRQRVERQHHQLWAAGDDDDRDLHTQRQHRDRSHDRAVSGADGVYAVGAATYDFRQG